jgi:hypothetical protein
MHHLTTLEFASRQVAHAERHWLYGHPYTSDPTDAQDSLPSAAHSRRRLPAIGRRRGARAFLGRHGLAA